MIVVIDTNVWVSAMELSHRRGVPVRAVERAIMRDTIATCAEIESETVRILTQKFDWSEDRASSALNGYLSRAIRVAPRGLVMGCRDRKDDVVLECAMLAGADAIIAGDKDLLVMEQFRGTRIITPPAYLIDAEVSRVQAPEPLSLE